MSSVQTHFITSFQPNSAAFRHRRSNKPVHLTALNVLWCAKTRTPWSPVRTTVRPPGSNPEIEPHLASRHGVVHSVGRLQVRKQLRRFEIIYELPSAKLTGGALPVPEINRNSTHSSDEVSVVALFHQTSRRLWNYVAQPTKDCLIRFSRTKLTRWTISSHRYQRPLSTTIFANVDTT